MSNTDYNITIDWIDLVDSTNTYLRNLNNKPEGFVIAARQQNNGRGMQLNTWESEPNSNLTISILFKPQFLIPAESFLLSMSVSLGVHSYLSNFDTHFSIKWPNDIYWKDKKIGGILIENQIIGNSISQSIVGIGLNINQIDFKNAPNPISLKTITNNNYDLDVECNNLLENIFNYYSILKTDTNKILNLYHSHLLSINQYAKYRDINGEFKAKIINVDKDGKLSMIDHNKNIRCYYFKEVEYLLT